MATVKTRDVLEVASQQLLKDGIHVLHTIGGDDTNTQAAKLSEYLLEKHSGKVIVVGMPKVCLQYGRCAGSLLATKRDPEENLAVAPPVDSRISARAISKL